MAKQKQDSDIEALKTTQRIAELKKRITQQKAKVDSLTRQAAGGHFSEALSTLRANVEAETAKHECLKQELRAWEQRQSQDESKENRQPAEDDNFEAKLAALRADHQQMAADLEAAKQEWKQKWEDERARTQAAESELAELKRKLVVQGAQQVESGPQQKPSFSVSTHFLAENERRAFQEPVARAIRPQLDGGQDAGPMPKNTFRGQSSQSPMLNTSLFR
ncbi:hypothetical protein M3Y99_01758300 [Aphelenchoides fujianensis]|nr:hypothetical protein M3Y99_01758300 [Aphelenchoides fujianensis]